MGRPLSPALAAAVSGVPPAAVPRIPPAAVPLRPAQPSPAPPPSPAKRVGVAAWRRDSGSGEQGGLDPDPAAPAPAQVTSLP